MPLFAIRPAVAADVPHILNLIRELAEFERQPDAVLATEADLLRDGFSDQPRRFDCLLAESKGQPIGFALYFHNFSTWRGQAGIHLEDLFVQPSYRGYGIGKALLKAVAFIAVAEGCPRLQWDVLEWNVGAIGFYEKVGARMLTDWRTMRVTGDELARLGGATSGDEPQQRVTR